MPSEARGIGAATMAFRRLLADAGGRDQARIDALVALVRHTVLAVTWGDDERLRTLTNASGESAAPFFTGHDVMQMAAHAFGWFAGDGTLPWKELGAREALRQAMSEGVQFVVLDLGTSYATEFARREVEGVLAAQKTAGVGAYAAAGTSSEIIRAAVRESTRPPGGAGAFLTPVPPVPPPPKMPVEMDEPFRRASRAPAAAPPRAVTTPVSEPPPASEAPARRSIAAAPVEPSRTALKESARAVPPAAPAQSPDAVVRDEPERAPPRDSLPVRRPAAATLFQVAPSKRPDSAPREAFPSAPPASIPEAGHAHRAKPPPVPVPSSVPAPGARPSPRPAAPASPPPPDMQAPRRPSTMAARAEADATSAARKLAEKMMRTTGTSLEAERFGRPLNRLAEKALEHIAESLRRYPEVEWACELADDKGQPLIGLRLDPAFQSRAPEITDVVLAAASERKVTVQVVLITETAKLRDARALGVVFYLWRRK